MLQILPALPPLRRLAPPAGKAALRQALALTADSSSAKAPPPAVALDVAASCPGSPAPAGGRGGGDGRELGVWAGVRGLLATPRHAAFFATTLLMGVG